MIALFHGEKTMKKLNAEKEEGSRSKRIVGINDSVMPDKQGGTYKIMK